MPFSPKNNEWVLQPTRFKNPSATFIISALGPNVDAGGQAGWTYLRTKHPGVDQPIQKNVQESMLRQAEENCGISARNDFHWARPTQREILQGKFYAV